jgi:hypothetical protein
MKTRPSDNTAFTHFYLLQEVCKMQKPIIPKEPIVPTLNIHQIERLTNITFLEEIAPEPCDAIFVFAGTHPGHWEKTIEAYNKGLSKQIIVTGGVSPTGVKHAEWKDKDTGSCSWSAI